MSHTDPAATPPTIPPRVRTVVYVASLGLNVATLMVLGVLLALGMVTAVLAAALAGAIMGPIGLLNSGLGTAYRPTLTLGQ